MRAAELDIGSISEIEGQQRMWCQSPLPAAIGAGGLMLRLMRAQESHGHGGQPEKTASSGTGVIDLQRIVCGSAGLAECRALASASSTALCIDASSAVRRYVPPSEWAIPVAHIRNLCVGHSLCARYRGASGVKHAA